MKTIQVSEDVYSYLLSEMKDFGETPDIVLRRLLLEKKNPKHPATTLDDGAEHVILWWKGVKFPEGMQLRAKANPNITAVVKKGFIVVKDKQFGSPSAAAVYANGGTSTNGWIFWEFYDTKSQKWFSLDLRRTAEFLRF